MERSVFATDWYLLEQDRSMTVAAQNLLWFFRYYKNCPANGRKGIAR